jgi:diguanylate cyclase (GGDEF)-like protein
VNLGWGRLLYVLLVPGGLLLLAALLLLRPAVVPASLAPVLRFYPYAVLVAGTLLAARLRSTRVLFALLVLALADWALLLFPLHSASGVVIFHALALLLPLNLAALALSREHALLSSESGWRLGLLGAQVFLVAILCQPELEGAARRLAATPLPGFGLAGVPQLGQMLFLLAAIILLLRFSLRGEPVDSGFLWALAAALMALRSGGDFRPAWIATGGLILVVAVIENFYRMAYHDQLTALPARRAFHDATLSLGERYTLAIVDIDHFKLFNDTYGHETGDQVLRLVASRLARVSGGGKAFRWGGEEFAVLFPESSLDKALPHLEDLRRAIERSTFRVRTLERRRAPRQGGDRRAPGGSRARSRTRPQSRSGVFVTVSIGAAEPGPRDTSLDAVIHTADQALYRAKANGRNRIESGAAPRATRTPQAGPVIVRRPS